MKQKYSIAIGYFLGVLSGCVLLMIVGAWRLHKDKGTLLMGAKIFGNISIFPSPADEKLPDVHEIVVITIEDKPFLNLFFDDKRNISQMSFMNDDEIITGVYRSPTDKSWERMDHGGFELNRDTYIDLGCNGSFDIRYRISADGQASKSIYSNGSWIAVVKCTFEKATRKEGEETVSYIFDDNSGWQEAR